MSATDTHEKQILLLLDQATGKLDNKTLKKLLRAYTSTLDWNIQERIESILAGADKEMLVMAILEEMPRLMSEAPGWAVSLLGEEVEHRFQLVQQCLASMSSQVKKAVHSVVNSDDFSSFYSSTESLFK